jgi:UDP-N-acetylmuramate dehydrogenase
MPEKGFTGSFLDELENLDLGEVLRDEPLHRHTSMGIGGKADIMVLPRTMDALRRIVSSLSELGISYLPVGNWTNIIVRDGGIRGVVISLKGLRDIRLENSEGGVSAIYAEAGIALAEFVDFAARSSLAGMEFCAGIPGSVGGAVRMNAGAFGREMKDIVAKISVLTGDGAMVDMHRDEMHFSYRNLELPEGSVVAAAAFVLEKGVERDVRRQIGDIMDRRKARHPLGERNAGSIFKNPKDVPAGRIIEEIGLKGTAIGGARISEKHGNFIVNTGGAKAADILALIELVQERVSKERGIGLELEVKIVGE